MFAVVWRVGTQRLRIGVYVLFVLGHKLVSKIGLEVQNVFSSKEPNGRIHAGIHPFFLLLLCLDLVNGHDFIWPLQIHLHHLLPTFLKGSGDIVLGFSLFAETHICHFEASIQGF